MTNSPLFLLRQRKTYQLLKWYVKVAVRRLPKVSKFNIDQKPIVLIHQMGKVGSLSIYHSLKADYCHQFDIYHTHFLNALYALESDTQRRDHDWQIYRQNQGSGLLPSDFYDITRIHNQLLVKTKQPLKIITMVRDPISRNISAYFQNLHWIWGMSNAYQEKSIPELAEGFWSQANHDFPLEWLDREIQDVVGLDVYAQPFPHDSAIQKLTDGNHNLLIIHTNASDQVKNQALQQFLEIEHFEVKRLHVSEKKEYGAVYKKFLSEVKIPEWYIDKMFNSRFARHFFSEEERQKRMEYWRKHPRSNM